MPIEIKELHIKVNVTPKPRGASTSSVLPAPSTIKQDALIAECVEQVLNIIKQKGER